jgi:outer membrane protein TolC
MSSSQSRLLRPRRRSCVPFWLGALLLIAASWPRPCAARRYTLPELIARVNAHYPGVEAARAGLDVAQAQLSQANRLWFPSGQLTFAITGSPDIRCAGAGGIEDNSLDQKEREKNCVSTTANASLTNTSDILKTLPFHGVALNLGITLTQPLYTFGKIEGAQHLAHAGIDAAHAQVDKDRAEVTYNITKAYWGLKWARAAYSTLDDGAGRLRGWVQRINDSIDNGKSTYTENDLARLKIALDASELALLDVDKARQVSLTALRTLAGDSEADIDDSELDVADLQEQPVSFYEDAARVHRPEARLLAAGMKASHAQFQIQRASLIPDLGLLFGFNYGYAESVDDPQNAFMSHPNNVGASIALGIRYDLAIAGKLANITKARADERVAQARRQQALGGIVVEIETAWQETRAARKRSDLLNHSEKVARGWYNAVDQNLTLGVAESRDLVDAARGYFELRLRHLQSIMDVNLAIAGLKQAAGTLVQ